MDNSQVPIEVLRTVGIEEASAVCYLHVPTGRYVTYTCTYRIYSDDAGFIFAVPRGIWSRNAI